MRRATTLTFLAVVVAANVRADRRVTFVPSFNVTEVQDDNLNDSSDAPTRDRIQRLTPELALRFQSPRLTGETSYGIDSERFATHSELDNARARERAALGLKYQATPRFAFAAGGGYVNTATAADLNADTGLAASRLRAHRLSLGSSFIWKTSSRTALEAGASSVKTNVDDGVATRSRTATLGLTHRMTPGDALRIDYEAGDLLFAGLTTESIRTHTLIAGWQHDLTERAHWSLRAGPRVTNGRAGADIAASIGHSSRSTAIDLSLRRTQTTIIGYTGAVDAEMLEAKFSYAPFRRTAIVMTPAVIRTSHNGLEGTVYRLGLGARYSLSSLLAAELLYQADRQHGAIDPLRAGSDFSHNIFSAGLTTRLWK